MVELYKDNKYLEFTVSLFTRCNRRCGYCWQDHTKDLNPLQLASIPQKIVDTYVKESLEREIDTVGIRLWGGELFSDDIPDKYFDIYRKLRTDIREKLSLFKGIKKIQFLYTTNGDFTKCIRVLDFLEPGDPIAISYNPIWSSSHYKMTFWRVLNWFGRAGHPVTVGIVLTNDIMKYLNVLEYSPLVNIASSPYVSSIVLNNYIPSIGWENLMPTDEEIGDFLVDCMKHNIPKISNLEMIKKSFETKQCAGRECECKFLPNIMDGKVSKDCVRCFSNLPPEMFYEDFLDDVQDISGCKQENVSEIKALKGITKRGCDTCEHVEYCPMLCWTSVIFNKHEMGECPLKKCYKYLEATKL